MIVGGIVCVFIILYSLWVELCAFLVVKMIVDGIVCDQSFMVIVGEIVCKLSSL